MQNSREMTKLAVTALEDKKAENIKILIFVIIIAYYIYK